MRQWEADARGLLPVEATMMVAIPELDGGIWPMTFGGRCGASDTAQRCAGCDGKNCSRDMVPHLERAATLAARVGAAGGVASLPAGRPQDRDSVVQLPAQRRDDRYGGLSRRVRLAVQHARPDERSWLHGRSAGLRRRLA